MKFVFWQGIISIHQKSFLEAVAMQAGVTTVTLIVEQDISAYRKSMGWQVPKLNGVGVIVKPDAKELKEIINGNRDAVHIFGGLRAGEMLARAFDQCVAQGCKIGVMTEPYNDAGLKGKLRAIKYKLSALKYQKHIQFVLTIGKQAERQYEQMGFAAGKIFPWAYFITVPRLRHASGQRTHQRIIYAGRLEQAKGICQFTEELLKTASAEYTLDIYGEGPDKGQIEAAIASYGASERVRIYPFMPHDELVAQYGNYDWVALPSAGKDGWGVIVSEGLLNGLKGICSNICGVSRVIRSGENGVVFDWSEPESCARAIAAMWDNEYAAPDAIARWASEGLSAEAGGRYLMQIVANVYNGRQRPQVPWEQAIIR